MALDFLSPIFGSKPKVPNLEELDLGEEQLKAIENNLAAAPEARKLADLTADEIDRLIKRTTPNFDEITGQASQNIEAYLKGEIPKDVQEFIKRSSAAKALEGGYGATGMHAALTARDLGLTSLDLTTRGLSAAESWLGMSERLYSPALSAFTGMFVTPMQQAAFDVEERNTKFQHSWLKNQIKAMPDPVLRGIHDTIMSLASAYLGGSYGGTFNSTSSAASTTPNFGGINTGGGGGAITSPGMSYDQPGPGAATYDWGAPIEAPSVGGAGSAPDAAIGSGPEWQGFGGYSVGY